MPEHVLRSEIEIITDGGCRRRWSATEKLRIVEETLDGRSSISVVARRNGVAPNLLYRWCRLMLEGGSVAVTEDDDVTSNKVVRQLEDRIREIERQLGRSSRDQDLIRGIKSLEEHWRLRSCARPWTSHSQKNRPCLRGRS